MAVFKQSVKRPKLRPRDRVFWVLLSRLWPNWRSALAIVQPETVIRWHRKGFRLYWKWKSRPGRPGRPPIEPKIRNMIRRMFQENPTWGAPRIVSELALSGHDVVEETLARHMVLTRNPPSQTWQTFLANHVPDIAACGFFTVPTVTFRLLKVTANPYAEWTAQQIINAFPYEEAPRFLIRDREDISGACFNKRVESMGIEEVPIAPRSPWQNPYCERVIGSIRRECLDHVIVLNERPLYRILAAYFDYYHNSRPHPSLDRNAPTPREVKPPSQGEVVSARQVGGLDRRYARVA